MFIILLQVVLSLSVGGTLEAPAGTKFQEKMDRRIAIRLSTPDELRAMQRVSVGTKPVPEHQAAIGQFLGERSPQPDSCRATLAGTIQAVTKENQTCHFEVWSVACENGVTTNITLIDCAIAQ